MKNSRRWPAEWEPQREVVFSFPIRNGEWGSGLETVSEAFVTAINQVAGACPVTLIVGDEEHFTTYAGRVRAHPEELPTDDAWVRDYGPLTILENQRPKLLDFRFNGWGNRFEWADNDRIPRRLQAARFPDLDPETIPFVLEGGSVDTDGHGTVLTTTKCLLNPNRNGTTTRAEVENILFLTLGADRVLWLENGHLTGDDTDAHVDTLARFLDPTTIAYAACDDPEDEHYPDLKRMEAELQAFRTPAGDPYRLLPLPWPPAVFSAVDGRRLPATYANFLITNGHLFLPHFFGGTGSDRAAAELLTVNTNYRVVGVNCRPFLEQNGALHCLTTQIFRPL